MKIYLSRHGQSIYNTKNLLGGNSGLSNEGIKYSLNLYNYFKNKKINNINLITSDLIRTKITAQYFPEINYSLSCLNEINAGIFEDKTEQFIKENYPNVYSERKKDKFNFIYPNGESYKMLQKRVLKVLNFLEKDKINIIICHKAVLRIIYGYFMNISPNDIPHIDIPLHTLLYIYINENNVIKNDIIHISD